LARQRVVVAAHCHYDSGHMAEGDAVEAGQIIAGRYQLIDEVGRGGVGTVFRALDRQSNTELAIKVILAVDSAGNASNTKVGRFLREARAMRRVRSPHVVEVYDHGSGVTPDGAEEIIY